MAQNSIEVAGVRIVASRVPNADSDELVKIAGELSEDKDVIAILISDYEGVKIVATAGVDALALGADVGKAVREMSNIVGGGGGGRPNMARGGGVDAAKIDDALECGISMIVDQLNSE